MPTPLGDFHQSPILEKPDFEDKLEKCIQAVKDGLPPKSACRLVWGINYHTYDRWYRFATEDMEAGFDETDSKIIKLILALSMDDEVLHRKLMKTAKELAVDEKSATMVKFLLETRFDYNPKKRSEVDIGTKEDTTFNINIVESKPKED